MPIRECQKARYPSDWPMVSRAIRARANDRCEGSPGIYDDCEAENGQPHPVTGSRVVLTVAHLNHQPEDCDLHNLRAMCQRCHLTYDAAHHAENARQTRRAKMAIGDLFDVN